MFLRFALSFACTLFAFSMVFHAHAQGNEAYDAIIASPLGQSNAAHWVKFIGDRESGLTELQKALESQTGIPTYTLPRKANRKYAIFAKGGSTVDEKTTTQGDDLIWWYIDEDRPGGALKRAVKLLQHFMQRVEKEKGKRLTIKIPWSQGEASTTRIAAQNTAKERAEALARYKKGTLATFNYLRDNLSYPVEFFIIKTNFIDREGALADGASPEEVIALLEAGKMIRQAQDELIADFPYVHFGADPVGLPSARDWSPETHRKDRWHYSPETYEILGRQTGQNIAKQMGY